MSPFNDDTVRQRVNQRLLKFKRLFVHLIATLVIAVGLSIGIEQDLVSSDLEFIIPAAVLLFVAHALWTIYASVKDFIIQQEVSRAPTEFEDKPKRRLALDDEGELIELDEVESEKRNLTQ